MKIRITLSDGSEWEELTYEPRSRRLVDSTGDLVQFEGRREWDYKATLVEILNEGGREEIRKYGLACPSSGAQVAEDVDVRHTYNATTGEAGFGAPCPSCGVTAPVVDVSRDGIVTYARHEPRVAL